MDNEMVYCYHCGLDLGVPKVIPTVSWGDSSLSLTPALRTLDCPRCHRPTIAASPTSVG